MPSTALVRIAGSGCAIGAGELEVIRGRARALLKAAGEAAYRYFPVDREALLEDTHSAMLSDGELVCRALTGPAGPADRAAHEAMRERARAWELSPKKALEGGVISTRVKARISCPAGFDWRNSDLYNKAKGCDDVAERIAGDGLPTAMYAAEFHPAEAMGFVTAPANLSLFTNYANGGPVLCGGQTSAPDIYHSIRLFAGITVDYVLGTIAGENWTAWMLRRGCHSTGKRYSDLMFDFGIRVYVPIEVDVDGRKALLTLIIGQVAAAAPGFLGRHIPQSSGFKKFVNGEYAKRLSLVEHQRGWR